MEIAGYIASLVVGVKSTSYLLRDEQRKADDIIVYPAHDAGSACGKNMTGRAIRKKTTMRSAGYDQRRIHPGSDLRPGSTAACFPLNVMMNIQGCERRFQGHKRKRGVQHYRLRLPHYFTLKNGSSKYPII